MAFERLELKNASCFGWSVPDGNGMAGWVDYARRCVSMGWTKESAAEIDRNLAVDVSRSFERLAAGDFFDLDSGMKYSAYFDSSKTLWFLELTGSPKAEVLDEDCQGFFGSKEFGRFARRCATLATEGAKIYADVVQEHLENGELLKVNEQKLAWILKDLGIGRFVDNLRSCRFGRK